MVMIDSIKLHPRSHTLGALVVATVAISRVMADETQLSDVWSAYAGPPHVRVDRPTD